MWRTWDTNECVQIVGGKRVNERDVGRTEHQWEDSIEIYSQEM